LDFCTEISNKFQTFFDNSGIKYDRFIRTTEPQHKEAVQALWRRLYDKGHIYKGQYSGWYCLADEAMLTEGQVTDTTDASGKKVKISIESGHKVEWVTEENYLFGLSKFQEPLLRWLKVRAYYPFCSACAAQVRSSLVSSI
jgi:methionyl-tRNA synthetase